MKKQSAGRTLSHPVPSAQTPEESAATGKILLFLAALVWIIVPIGVFFIFHKPLPPAALERVRGISVDLLGAAWLIWIAVGIGRPFIRRDALSTPERIALSGALGFGVLGILFLAVAWAGIFTSLAVILLCSALTALVSVPLVRDMIGWLRNRPARPPAGAFSIALGVFTAASLLLSLGIALSPPIAFDALVYHFRIPQQIIASRSLNLPDTLFLEMPHVGEMLYAAALAVTGRAETAAVLGWMFGLLALIGVTGIARRWGLRHSLLPAALLLSGDTLAQSMGWGYVDWAAALFGFAALAALTRREAGARWIVLAGVFAGFGAGTKYTGGIVLGALALALLSVRDPRRSIRELALLAGGFLISFSPWVLRGLILWGNPLPPLLDGGEIARLNVAFFSGRPLANAWLLALAEPWLQSTIGIYGALPFGVTIGPLLLAFLPGALMRQPEETGDGQFLLRLLWIGALLYWAVSGVGGLFSVTLFQPRLYLALFPGIALLSAYGFEQLWRIRLLKIRLGALAAVLTLLVLAAQLAGFTQTRVAAGQPNYLAGSLTEKDYLEHNLGWYVRAMESVRALPAGARVLMLWEARGYRCSLVCAEDATIDRWYLAMRTYGSTGAILAAWRAEGWTHILIFEAGAAFERETRPEYTAADWAAYDELRTILPVAERYGDGYVLYALD